MKYYVYIIISYHKSKFYTYVGYTNDLKRRLKLHNTSKGAKYTRGKKWNIMFYKTYKTKSLAMINEFRLKKDKNKRKNIKLNYIKKNYENINFTSL